MLNFLNNSLFWVWMNQSGTGVRVWLFSMVQLAPDWLVNNCVRNWVAVSKDGRIQIAYFREDRAIGIEMNANGQLSPGITDLHALQDTNSAPFARHKHMVTHSKSILDNICTEGEWGGQTIWMRQWWSRRGQRLAATLMFFMFFGLLFPLPRPPLAFFLLGNLLAVGYCCSEMHQCTHLTVWLDFKKVCDYSECVTSVSQVRMLWASVMIWGLKHNRVTSKSCSVCYSQQNIKVNKKKQPTVFILVHWFCGRSPLNQGPL